MRYAVTVLRRLTINFEAVDEADAVKMASVSFNFGPDGDVLHSVIEGWVGYRAHPDAGGPGAPPTGPTPGTPTIKAHEQLEVHAA